MSVFKQLLKASFNGFEFLTPDESLSGGKKTVDHEYPAAQKRRYVEELGAQAGVYTLTAVIHGSDAIQSRILFQNELEKGGRGLLIHPSIGQIMAVCTDWTSRSSDTRVGEFLFDITFKESEENISLTAGIDSVNLISNLAGQSKLALDTAFLDQYIDLKTPYILQESATQLTGVINDLDGFTGDIANIIPENLTDFNSVLDIAENLAPTTVRTALNFVNQFRGIYNAFENLSMNVGSFYSSYIGQVTYGDDRISKTLITQKRINEDVNLSAFEDLTRVNALISSYEAATYADYTTETDLISVKAELESSYDYIIENSRDDGLVFNPDVKSLLNELRSTSRNVFDQKQQNTWRVVDIDAGESSLALTSYRYYENIDNIQTLSDLNPNVNFSINENEIKGIS